MRTMASMRVMLVCAVMAGMAAPAAAQDRPFVFSTTTADDTRPALRFDYDVGVGERAFQSDTGNQPEQRIGMQASLGRVTFLARFGIAGVGSAYQSSQSGEVLYALLPPASRIALAGGGGVLHEADGVNVLLARVVAGRSTDASNVYGNLLFEKPLSSLRDELDLITSVGWARKLSRGMSLGVEAIGEDLEGFWDQAEAEGGARILAGPSFHVSPVGRRWQLTATGGPEFHPSDTGRASGALRDLPPDTRRTSYAFKVSFSIALASTQ
jgi:hypothetical protein